MAESAAYANDYRDLSDLKRLADTHGIAILLIHHLRKEKADDVFNRISGTTAISSAVDASFTLAEEQGDSGRVRLSCIGRDILASGAGAAAQRRQCNDGWKLDLIQAINEALEYAVDRESFIENMEYEGYEVTWTDTWKHITFTCPNGRKCRDSSLHDETFLKENLEALFTYRQAVGFCPGSVEPDNGWMGDLADGLIQLGKSVERLKDLSPLPTPPTWTDSKQRRREAIKKLAMGQKLSGDQRWEQTM